MVDKLNKQIVLESAFKGYAKFGNSKSDGSQITLTNIDKWLKEVGIIDGKKVSTTDTAILFQRFKSKTIDFKQFMIFIESLAKECKLNVDDLIGKLSKSDVPGTSRATQVENSNIVSRMTDTSKYTGSHKERFDKQGKGKGKSGREDTSANTGYVQGYKHKDTYDKKKK
ncbi:tubulin polymerization-promoting protein homolog [Colias croceus]|uniref:tubulin polymerization-promoting protein homolog n=1 Tax=Colias crocea TaxID=72248 RepID=UPI001E27A321|nr:tubulin polymerization-promoting protein homolog [Colias croceus]